MNGVDANIIDERDFDSMCLLSKSFSIKVEICNSHHEEREMMKSNHKTHFSSLKKMLGPIMKLKFLHNSSLMEPRTTSRKPITVSLSKYRVFPISLLNDFSRTAWKIDDDRANDQVIKIVASPIHLHVVLKREINHGGSSYECFVKDSKDLLSFKLIVY